MGRTNATYRDRLDDYERRCRPFRRALRRERQQDFDGAFERARTLAHAAGHLNATDPERAALLSMVVAQETELRALRDELESLRERVED